MAANMQHILKGVVDASRINRQTIRATTVLENRLDGRIISRVVDVRDVEKRKSDCPEVIMVDEQTEAEILRELKVYRNTSLYIATMVTIMLIIFLFDTFG